MSKNKRDIQFTSFFSNEILVTRLIVIKFSQYITRELLTKRSSQMLVIQVLDIAQHLTAIGHIQQALELVEISHASYPFEIRQLERRGLSFAFESINTWPDFFPEAARTPKYLSELDKHKNGVHWGQPYQQSQLPHHNKPGHGILETLKRDEGELQVLLGIVDNEGENGSFLYRMNDQFYAKMWRVGVVALALDTAITLENHEADVNRLLDIIRQDLQLYIPIISESRAFWTLSKTSLPEPPGTREETNDSFSDIKSALIKRFENGPERQYKDKTMQELVEILNHNTLSQPADEENAGYAGYRDAAYVPRTISNGSTLHHPATPSEISTLESKLNVTLPSDYKEFLSATNGLNSIWNGYYRQHCLTGTEHVKPILESPSWAGIDGRNSSELFPWQEFLDDENGERILIDWPMNDFKNTILLTNDEDGEPDTVWLVKPELVQKAKDGFFKRYDIVGKATKRMFERLAIDHFGGLQEMKDIEWAVFLWRGGGDGIIAWKSFREFLEYLVLKIEITR